MNRADRYTCEQAFARLDDFLDRELSEQEMQLIREHLSLCEWCATQYNFEEEVLDSLKTRLKRIPAPAGLMARISRAIAKSTADAGEEKGTNSGAA